MILEAVSFEPWADLASGKITLTGYLERFPEVIREWVLLYGGDPVHKLHNLLSAWETTLRQLARAERPLWVNVPMEQDEFGYLRPIGDPLARIILYSETNWRYLRECANCDRLFWAKSLTRAQQRDPKVPTGCSAACKNNLRVQRARFLREHGFGAGVKLTAKDRAKRDELLWNWMPTKRASKAR